MLLILCLCAGWLAPPAAGYGAGKKPISKAKRVKAAVGIPCTTDDDCEVRRESMFTINSLLGLPGNPIRRRSVVSWGSFCLLLAHGVKCDL